MRLLAAAIACVGIAAAAAPVESVAREQAWIGKNVVDRALDTFHRLSGWRPPVATTSEAFCAAVADGDVEALELTIRQGVDIEYQCPVANGTATALYIASRAGHTGIVDVLLREGAAVNSPEGRPAFPGETALHAAAGWGQTETVELLLRMGANASQGNAQAFLPLHNAAMWGHLEVIEVLLQASVDINSRNSNGWTPIHRAATSGQVESVRLLLERGADATIATNEGFNPLYVAAQHDHSEIVRLLLAVDDPRQSIKYPGGYSPLYKAAHGGHNVTLGILLEDGRLPLDGRTDEGMTPLIAAAEKGHFACVAALLRSGADASIASKSGETAAQAAARDGHQEVAALLEEHLSASEAKARARRRRDRQAMILSAQEKLCGFALFLAFLLFGPLTVYWYKLYWKRKKKKANRLAIRDRVRPGSLEASGRPPRRGPDCRTRI